MYPTLYLLSEILESLIIIINHLKVPLFIKVSGNHGGTYRFSEVHQQYYLTLLCLCIYLVLRYLVIDPRYVHYIHDLSYSGRAVIIIVSWNQ